MGRQFRSGPQWWPEGEHWPPRGGRGYEAWAGFGRRMFMGALVFIGFLVAVAVLIGALIATAVAGMASTGRVGVVLATLFVLVAGGWLLRMVVRRTWRPVRDLIGAAGRLADGDYSARVDERSSAGIRAVASSFNSMAERLEEADEQRRRLMSDLGHELRTPLAVIRGEIEAVIDGVRDGGPEHMESMLDEVEVLERLIEDLRILTLSEAGKLPLQTEQADLMKVVEEVAASYRPAASTSGIEVLVEAPTGVPSVEMDPVRIRQALTNLVVNSIRAMPGGGRVTIKVKAEDDRITTQVIDTGPGIDPAQLEEVFGRFVKSENSPGSGLGLSIARGLVRAHRGDVEIIASGPDGTTAVMWLPR
ncbi:MAG: ATP-binding protein [Acidimicrobiia bacterium]|nr:ATP-binding protein [Acidimicrobiia bacterium]MDH3397626.1 ATP-binding protein [Acidimicrobiia bacterium]MDH5616579.1 ATP-binding protein [Acidimicrobiia bacterium]